MKFDSPHISFSGITRVIINRISVWERTHSCNDTDCKNPLWKKTSGGPGFKKCDGCPEIISKNIEPCSSCPDLSKQCEYTITTNDRSNCHVTTKEPNKCRHLITDHQMHSKIQKLLSKEVVTGKFKGFSIVTEQYEARVHGNTLNIVQRDYSEKKNNSPKRKSIPKHPEIIKPSEKSGIMADSVR